jgi:hypothetical protein
MTATDEDRFDRDVVVGGGGPSGCSTGVFTARYGLDTVVFDRGRSSVRLCAHLENYLGFPAGVDVETFYGLIHDHAAAAGCDVVSEMVEAVDRADDGGFLVETDEGTSVTTERVVAAARYDAGYLRPLDDSPFDGRDGEEFDRDYADADGTTPVDGLYVAAPAGDADAQAILSAGRGARVARTLLADVRRERGYPEALADHWDWRRREAELSDERADRDRWRDHLDARRPDDHGVGDERWETLREREIDRRFEAYLSRDEIDRLGRRGQRRLLDHVDDELVLEAARDIEAAGEHPEASD